MMTEIIISGPLKNNTIIFACDETKIAAIVDPSMECEKKVFSFLEKHKLSLEWILLTHSHWDHIASVSELKQKTKAKVAIHLGDAMSLQHPPQEKLSFFIQTEGVKADLLLKDHQKIMYA